MTAPTPADVPGQGEVEEPVWVERWRGKTIAEAIFEYGAIRGDLSEQYARDQLAAILTFMLAEQIAAAEQRGREDNADHGMCYVSGSKALAERDAEVARRAWDEGVEAHRAYSNLKVTRLANPYRATEPGA